MGEALTSADPLLARKLGLATVYQDDSLVRELTVAENLLLGVIDGPTSLSGKRAWAAALLAPYDLGISPDTHVGQLNPAQRQFLEIVKALAANPSVLLLDEPTSRLDFSGVEKLSGIVEQIAAGGAAVVYVSHRLPEILALADRVTILRDGDRARHLRDRRSLSENDLIALMVGRPIEPEYPGEHEADVEAHRPFRRSLDGPRFQTSRCSSARRDSGLRRRRRQRPARGAARAWRPHRSRRISDCDGRSGSGRRPRDALDAGILSLSADRAAESIFPPLGVRENMTVQVLQDFAAGGLISRARKKPRRTRSSTNSISSPQLSTSRSAACPAAISKRRCWRAAFCTTPGSAHRRADPRRRRQGAVRHLPRHPRQGGSGRRLHHQFVRRDGARRALRPRAGVLARARDSRTDGREITEESIVSSFLRSKEVAANGKNLALPGGGSIVLAAFGRLVSGNQRWMPLVFLTLLILAVGAYASGEDRRVPDAAQHPPYPLATAPLALVTMAQFNVLMVRGFDISVGSLMSLTVVLASFLIAGEIGVGSDPPRRGRLPARRGRRRPDEWRRWCAMSASIR